ncbi:hypothetical protein Tco_0789962 [Tanacetum coccineum]
MTTKAQQIALDNALVSLENQHVIGKCNMRINPGMKPKEPTYQVVLDALALTTCYPAFIITAEDPIIYMHQFWSTINKHNASYRFKFDNKRFTKIIIHHFLKKDKSISMRNRTFMHTAQDDSLLAYKTYYAIASGAEPPKSKKSQKKSNSAILSEESLSKKKPASKPKPTKKKAPVKADKGKSDGTDFELRVPDEQQRKTSGTDEGTDDEDDIEDEIDNDGNDDDGDNDDNDDDSDDERTESDRDAIPNLNQSNEKQAEEEEENVDERVHTPDDYELTDEEDNANNAKEVNEEEEDDAEELYRDINVNLRKEDVEMTDADQGGADQHNVSRESGFEHEEEDAHVTLTAVYDTQKTEGPMQSSSVSSDFTSKLLNFENPSPIDNEIASLMDTTVCHEEPSSQTSSLYTVPITAIPVITSVLTTTIPPPPPFFNPLSQHATPTPTPTSSEATTLFLALPDFSFVFKFNDRIDTLTTNSKKLFNKPLRLIMKNVEKKLKLRRRKLLEAAVLAKSSSQPKSTYEAAASLSEFELTKILMDNMEENKSHLRADYKRELYDALVKSYNTDKDLFDTYGNVFTLKKGQDKKDKDQDPSIGLDRGTKRRKSSKEVELPKDPRLKEGKSSSSSKGTRSHHKSSSKLAHVKEPSHTVDDSRVQ